MSSPEKQKLKMDKYVEENGGNKNGRDYQNCRTGTCRYIGRSNE